jgi:acylphosphatase
MICVRCIVSGKVQGVWYRDTTRRKAQSLSLTGCAINLPDGTVEVVACGEASQVNALQEWLWEGSQYSNVTSVKCESIEAGSFNQFNIG